jgi:pimeloyl-ACP methyl ester carboxylesterase
MSLSSLAVAAPFVVVALVASAAERGTKLIRVSSKDGTLIAIECAGTGPTLLMVHGGVGDRTRWTPMIPLLSSRFTACAMDRRGHGASGDSLDYSLGTPTAA